MAGRRVRKECDRVGCTNIHHPRAADLSRGWGRFCSKSCKAIEQTQRTGVRGPTHVLYEESAYDYLISGEWDMDDSTYWNGKD